MKIPIVDENDEIIGYKERDEINANDIYRVTSILVTDGGDNILLQKRSLSKKNSLFILAVLTDQSIHSALWKVVDQKVEIISKSKVRFYFLFKTVTFESSILNAFITAL
jgi:hypothetical protein